MGFSRILGNVREDLRLIEADMMTDDGEAVAEFKKRRAEEKEAAEGPQVNA